VEVRSNLFWTPDLASSFKKMHGYDIGKYAMLLAIDNDLGFGSVYLDRVYTDASDRGQRYVSDYRATMTSLLTLYYEHLTEWSERFLGLEVGYNLPVDMVSLLDMPDPCLKQLTLSSVGSYSYSRRTRRRIFRIW
jgi:hypothetical protein